MDIKGLVPKNLVQWVGGAIIGAGAVFWVYTNIIIPQNARMYDATLKELSELRDDNRELTQRYESAIDDKSKVKDDLLEVKDDLMEVKLSSKDALRDMEKGYTEQISNYERKLDKFNTTAQLDTVYMDEGDIFFFQSGTSSVKCIEDIIVDHRMTGVKLQLEFHDKQKESFYIYYNERNVVEHDNVVYYIYCLDPNSLTLKNRDYYESKTSMGRTPLVVYVLSK